MNLPTPPTNRLNTVYLSLGSNINPEQNLRAASQLLAAYATLVAVSAVWETQPVGRLDQPNYLNAAAIITTALAAEAVKTAIIGPIEQRLGRVRTLDKNAPRTIDIDIVFFNDEIFDLGSRHVPNPEVLERAFVAIPLAEIAPEFVHPETGQPLQVIAAQFTAEARTMVLREDLKLTQAQDGFQGGL